MTSLTGFFLIFSFYSLEIVVFMVVYLSRTYSRSQRWQGTLLTCAPFHEHVGLARPEVCASLILLISHSNTPSSAWKKGNKDEQKQKECFHSGSRRERTRHLKTSERCRTASQEGTHKNVPEAAVTCNTKGYMDQPQFVCPVYARKSLLTTIFSHFWVLL